MSQYYTFGGLNLPTPSKKLEDLLVADVWPTSDIHYLTASNTIGDALQVLKNKNILSLPVVDATTSICIGVVDVLDIATYIAAAFGGIETNKISLESLRSLQHEGRFIAQEPLLKVLGFNKTFQVHRLPEFPVRVTTPLVQLMAVFSNGIHRVPVIDNNNKIVNFVSQSDLLRYLAEHSYLLTQTGLASQRVGEIGTTNTVHYCREDALVLDALKNMASLRVSALPILNTNGKLVGNFSASDIRGLGPNDFGELLSPVVAYLNRFNVKSLHPLTCKHEDTLEYVIMKVVATRVHRLWVIDNTMEQKLTAVLSLTDIIKPFLGIKRMET